MTRPSVSLEQLAGFNGAVEVNNSSLVLPVGDYTTAGNSALGTLRLSEVENDPRCRRVYAQDSALHGPFTGQSCGVGANLGPTLYTTALVDDTKVVGGELVLSTSLTGNTFREIGVGVDNPTGLDEVYSDTQLGYAVFNCSGAQWDATRSVLKVPDGVYHVGLSLYVREGGNGRIRVRLVGPDGVEVLRATDTLGGDGTYDTFSRFTNWGTGSHTIARLNGEYTLYLLLDTSSVSTGFCAIINVAGITPADPNVEFPAA